MNTRKVIGQRPTTIQADRIQTGTGIASGQAGIPANWVICNAPRPIVGHIEWTGDFVSGIFYAAIDPDGEGADWMTKENTSLHAVVLEYITLEQTRAWVTEFYKREYGVSDEEIAGLSDREIIGVYMDNQPR